jgi:HSP20 family molecular chaperone IbpA
MQASNVIENYSTAAKVRAYEEMAEKIHFSTGQEPGSRTNAPPPFCPTEIEERDGFLLVKFFLHGLRPANFDIEAQETKISISADWLTSEEPNMIPRMRNFRRVLSPAGRIDVARVEAQYRDGSLRLYIPLLERCSARRIAVTDEFSRPVEERIQWDSRHRRNPDPDFGASARAA